MVSIKDIASACGVSIATVSKALNGHTDIGEATRKRVREMADKMGYQPNAAARMLKTNRSHNIGVLYADDAGSGLTHEYFSGVLNGIKNEAENLGYDITFIRSKKDATQTYLQHARYRNFDGVIVVCGEYADDNLQELLGNDSLPVVTIDYTHQNCSSVSSNNLKGIEDLLSYIIKLGHKKIAYVHGQDYSFVTKDRLAGYHRIMKENNLPVPDGYVLQANYLQTEGASECTRKLLDLDDAPTCILYPDDTSLIGGINVIRERGMDIPADISIAGYDGAKVSQLMKPRLTTIHQDTDQIGTQAAKKLVQMIEDPKTAAREHVVVDGILLEGESVRPL